MTTTAAPETYVQAIAVVDLFVDPTYQRDCDLRRAKKMAAQWDPRLVGVLDVSDRGDTTHPRYAIVNGQHRAAAALIVDPTMHLVANVHTGLTVVEEAKLFDDIDRKTRALTTWDRWKARRASGDRDVETIERIASGFGLQVSERTGEGHLRCPSALEQILAAGDQKLLADTLSLIVDTWGKQQDALEASIVRGVSILLDTYNVNATFNTGRLADAMEDLAPRQVKAQAQSLREFETGSVAALVALVLVRLYNKSRGAKLDEQSLR
ncbi:DUF6551 family protein [Rhodococcus sp. NPDC003348]